MILGVFAFDALFPHLPEWGVRSYPQSMTLPVLLGIPYGSLAVALGVLVLLMVAAADQAVRQAPGRYQILDLRDALEFEDGHLPQAIHLDPRALEAASIDRYRPSVVVTEDGDAELFDRTAGALKLAVNLTGGMMQWRMSRLPEVSGLTDSDALRRGRPG